MTTVDILLALLSAYAGFWALYVVVPPAIAAVVGRRRDAAPAVTDTNAPTIAVLIPAHDMEAVIGRCVAAVQACHYPRDKRTIFVIADHCTDLTADAAEQAGARVLVRDEGPPGKTYTLAWTLENLGQLGADPDIYLVTDATARVDVNFLAELASFIARGEDIVVAHSMVEVENQKWFARCLGLTLVHRNLQNWSRERLRLSALIEGRGMAYSRRYVRRYGWSLAAPAAGSAATHPTEDWRHGVQAAEQGLRVAFAEAALVYTPLRGSLAAATQQGIRWERGRMANATTHALRVLAGGVRRRSSRMIFAALDALQPPVAILGAVCTLAAIAGLALPHSPISTLTRWPLAIVALYGVAVVLRGRRAGIDPVTVLWAPVYIAWRCFAFCLAWVSPRDRASLQQKNERSRLPTAK
jgi:cellulose synthase/poly-beta-1,6-N-acetylglucosamine synthase-like glycosyltransferase